VVTTRTRRSWQNLDFSHTHPQVIVPSGGRAVIDADARTVSFDY
jgi:muramoyltetrapeptide carboxypeptidase LdcA involved in peptidoglycan recycling